jgi:hypothetical protein
VLEGVAPDLVYSDQEQGFVLHLDSSSHQLATSNQAVSEMWVKFGSIRSRSHKLTRLSNGRWMLSRFRLDQLHEGGDLQRGLLSIMYSINDVDFFVLDGGLNVVPDLQIDHQESRGR